MLWLSSTFVVLACDTTIDADGPTGENGDPPAMTSGCVSATNALKPASAISIYNPAQTEAGGANGGGHDAFSACRYLTNDGPGYTGLSLDDLTTVHERLMWRLHPHSHR
jgi:hypothetical protein